MSSRDEDKSYGSKWAHEVSIQKHKSEAFRYPVDAKHPKF